MEPTEPTVNYDYVSDDYGPTCDTETTPGSNYKLVLLPLVFCLGLTGNMTVIWVLLRYIKLRSMTDVCLLNLSVSDLLLVLTVPLWAHHQQHPGFAGDATCKVMAGVYQVGLYSGTLFVTLMTVDRYLAIVHAVAATRVRTLFYGTAASVVIWVVSLGAALPQAVFTVGQAGGCEPLYPENSVDSWKMFRNFSENIMSLFICLPVMVYCYINILIVLKKSRNSKKDRAMKLIFIIVGLFVVCWVPYNIVVFLLTLQLFNIENNCRMSKQIDTAFESTEFIALAHCCVNPVIYAFVGEKFRKCLGSVLSKYPFCKHLGTHPVIVSRGSDNETSNTIV